MRDRGVAVLGTAMALLAAGVLHGGVKAHAGQEVVVSAVRSAPVPEAGEPPTGTAALSGVVVDTATGLPVGGAIVTLGRTDNPSETRPRAVTDARGRFVFQDLPAGTNYFLGARRFGYAYSHSGSTAPTSEGMRVLESEKLTLADGQWLGNVKVPLYRLGAITGRVMDERGEPVVGIAVQAFTTAWVAGSRQLVSGPMATTDDRGVYRLGELDPGRYVVSVLSVQATVLASTPGGQQQRAVGELARGGYSSGNGASVNAPTIDVDGRHRLVVTNFATPPPPAAGQTRAYPAVFYPEASTATNAAPIEITYGANRGGVDLVLRPASTWRVSGHLDGTAGVQPGMLLRMLPAGSETLGFGSEAATTLVESGGTFTFLNVPAGRYTITGQASVIDLRSGSISTWLDDAPGFPAGQVVGGSWRGVPGIDFRIHLGQPTLVWGRASIAVEGHDLDDVVVPTHPTVKITGHITLAEGTTPPPANALFVVRAEPANGDPGLGNPDGMAPRTDPALPFTVDGLVGGTYLIQMNSSLDVMSVSWRGQDLKETGFDASLGRDFDDVAITLTDKKTEVNGVVRGASGTAVIAFPVERDRWVNFGWNPPRIRTVMAAPTGVFQLQRLPEGEYFVIAVEASKIDAWVDPAFLAAAAPLATRVSLKWGDKKTQNLSLVQVIVK